MLFMTLQYYYRFHHPNILQIMGYCFTEDVKALVYQYLEKGSLYNWIHDVQYIHVVLLYSIIDVTFFLLSMQTSLPSLTLDLRVSIVKDVYRGVAYLHADKPPFIHQDIKS